MINSFQVFAQAYVMTRGGPVNSTKTIVYYLFQQGFENFHMGYASALAYVLFVIIVSPDAVPVSGSRDAGSHYEL